MTEPCAVLKNEERVVFALRSLYRSYGYSQYKVSKFEEYDLYARNRSFLDSGSILTFTDTNGRLMALKPDVTLSIIKNTREQDAPLQKLYYNETVYRTAPGANGFREIMQTGLECIGEIDLYCVSEVVMLAARSLEQISDRWVLDISHMGVMSGVLEELGLDSGDAAGLLRCMGAKNLQGMKAACAELGLDSAAFEMLRTLGTVYGPVEQALEQVRRIPLGEAAGRALAELEQIAALLAAYGVAERVYLDFSIVNDMNYYNGVIFRGFIDGIPTGVLSGGRYDNLLHRMGKQGGAVGFAVYLDQMDRFGQREEEYDVDVLLLREPGAAETKVIRTVQQLVAEGKRVKVQRTDTGGVRWRQRMRVTNGGEVILENHD